MMRLHLFSGALRLRKRLPPNTLGARCSSFKRDWATLSTGQREAWHLLGQDEDAWKELSEGRRVPLPRFEALAPAQQAAVLHGLGVDAKAWDALVARKDAGGTDVPSRPNRPSGELSPVDAVVSGLGSAAWSVAKRYGPALGALLGDAKRPGAQVASQLLQLLPWAVDLREGPVEVQELETVVYLDDSGSMRGANLSEAQGALRKMAHLLQDRVRVCTFGVSKQVVVPRESPTGSAERRDFSLELNQLNPELISLQWKGKSPGTYMWHMILEDVREKYIPGRGKLRVIVITDGLDTHSPPPYQGIQGMHPMMQELLKDGYDIEWHIVVVDVQRMGRAEISRADAAKYEALAEVTGGGFLYIDKEGVMNDYSARHFLSALEKAFTGGELLNSKSFQEQHGKGARFLSRLHESNQHAQDPTGDRQRRQRQLEDYRRRNTEKVPWLPLLEARRTK